MERGEGKVARGGTQREAEREVLIVVNRGEGHFSMEIVHSL